MKFDIRNKIKNGKGELISCKITSDVWDSFALYKDDEGHTHEDFCYCRKCFKAYKIHDSRSKYHLFSYIIKN